MNISSISKPFFPSLCLRDINYGRLLMHQWIFLFVTKHLCLSVPTRNIHVTMFSCRMEHYGLQGTAVTTNAWVITNDKLTDDLLPDSHETGDMWSCFVFFFTSPKKNKKQLIEKQMILHLVRLGVIVPPAPVCQLCRK